MLYLECLFASLLLAQPADAAPPEVAPVQPTPVSVTVHPAPTPLDQPPPARSPEPDPKPTDGLGMLIAGPLLVLAGVPLSFAGNAMWRNNCGPNSSTRQCTDGTFGSMGMHTLAGGAYGTGMVFTGLGARKRAAYSAFANPGNSADGVPLIVTGAAVLPIGLTAMLTARLFFWLPTPECVEYSCVRRYQAYSTLTVGASALVAAAGAGMLMYGIRVKRAKRSQAVSFSPHFGRGVAGLQLTGRF